MAQPPVDRRGLVWTYDDRVVAAAASVDLDRPLSEIDELVVRIGARFRSPSWITLNPSGNTRRATLT